MEHKITESQIKDIIFESIKKVLNEYGPYSNNNPYSPWAGHIPSIEQRKQTKDALNKEIEDAGGTAEYFEKRRERIRNSSNPITKSLMETGVEQQNIPANNQEYYTPEQAEAMGFRPENYQDFRKPYTVWVKGTKIIKVKQMPQRRSKSADWDGSEYSHPYSKPLAKLKESQLRNIIAESINKVLKEGFHHVTVGENPLVKGRYGVHSIPYGDMGHFDGTKKECDDYAPEMEKAAEERFQKDIQHAIEMGMSEEEMNKILHDTYSRRGNFIPSINSGSVSWDKKQSGEIQEY